MAEIGTRTRSFPCGSAHKTYGIRPYVVLMQITKEKEGGAFCVLYLNYLFLYIIELRKIRRIFPISHVPLQALFSISSLPFIFLQLMVSTVLQTSRRQIDQRRADVSRASSNVPCNEFCLSVRPSVASVFCLGTGLMLS